MRPTLCYEKQAQTGNLAGTRKPSKQIGYQTLNTSMQMQDPDVRLPPHPLPSIDAPRCKADVGTCSAQQGTSLQIKPTGRITISSA